MKRIIYILLIGLCLASCEEFLSEQPVYNQTLKNTVKDYDGARYIVNGMYATLSSGMSDIFGGNYPGVLSSQAGVSRMGGATYYQMTYGGATSSSFWQKWYEALNAANAAIIAITDLADDKFPDPTAKTKLLAEAHCFRGWVCTHLLQSFGHFKKDDEYGILFREEMSDMSNIYLPRLSVRESYEVIFKDLDIAIKDMDNYTNAKRLSKQMAQVTKVKLLLNRGWDGDYAEALKLLEECIAGLPAHFKMNPDMRQMFQDAWDSNEVLFARYLEDGTGRGYYEGAYTLSLIQIGEQYVSDDVVPSSLNIFYPEFNTWLEADPRYDATMGWCRRISATGTLHFCPSKVAREGRIDMNDKFTTYYFRYPELLLMQAELKARTGASIADALAPINKLRKNRTNPVLPQIALPSSQQELMDIIFKEYCLELYLENGSEWFAALRFQKDGRPWLYSLKPDVQEVSEDLWCWQIPDSETSLNTQIKINPGFATE